jgi:hypothetical protein
MAGGGGRKAAAAGHGRGGGLLQVHGPWQAPTFLAALTLAVSWARLSSMWAITAALPPAPLPAARSWSIWVCSAQQDMEGRRSRT